MTAQPASPAPLGAILAGGRSRRFGAPKALARVGGRTIVERVRDALRGAPFGRIVLITGEPALYAGLGVPARGDEIAGAGPLGGIHAALRWAEQEGRGTAFCVACDLPLLSSALVRLLLERAATTDADVVAPASPTTPQLAEPLCAVYAVRCLPAIEARLARAEYALQPLLRSLRTEIVSVAELRAHGIAETTLLNVNTPADLTRAEHSLHHAPADDAAR